MIPNHLKVGFLVIILLYTCMVAGVQASGSYGFVDAWGTEGTGDGELLGPTCIAVDSEGNVYVAEIINNRIQKFSNTGTFITKWGTEGSGDGQFSWPRDIAVDSAGNVYVADAGNDRIQKFSNTGTFITKWGTVGDGDGQFNGPQGIAVDSAGNVYVADTGNHRIQKFSNIGTFITKWGAEGSGDGQFKSPQGIAADGAGNVYVAEIFNHRIQKFSNTGTFITKWGTEGSGDGQFQYPIGIAVDSAGNVYVADSRNHRIQKFSSTGTFITKWGSWGTGDGMFDGSYGIAVDSDGNIYVTEIGNQRIQIFTREGAIITPPLTENGNYTDYFMNLPAIAVYFVAFFILAGSILKYRKNISYNQGEIERQEEERIKREKALKEEQEKKRKRTESLVTKAKDLASRGHYTHATKTVDQALAPLPNSSEYQELRAQLVKNDPKPDLSISPQTVSLAPKQFPPELANRYSEITFLNKGGFARVYRAKKKDGSEVAVKVPISLDESTGKTFLTEIKNWTHLDHENIVKVYDYNIMPVAYFEMEFCDSSLSEVDRPMACDEAAWILFNVCEGLKYAHARSILHCDLKPQNIMLKKGVPKVADWGLSRVMVESRSSTTTSFTPYYASPEQITGRKKDARTDIWQLGVILYELVCGALPFTGENMVEIGMKIAKADPLSPTQINPETKKLEPIILKCLKGDPDLRYQSIVDLQRNLAGYLNITYAESLKLSIRRDDFSRSARYCSELMLMNLKTGELAGAYRYTTDLINYVQGDVREETLQLAVQIRSRLEEGLIEIPGELMEKARIIDHKVRVGHSNM